jgi:hypothetical protein
MSALLAFCDCLYLRCVLKCPALSAWCTQTMCQVLYVLHVLARAPKGRKGTSVFAIEMNAYVCAFVHVHQCGADAGTGSP